MSTLPPNWFRSTPTTTLPDWPKETQSAPIVRLHEGDPRAEALEAAILATVYERGDRLPIPLVIGVLRLVEHRLIADANTP